MIGFREYLTESAKEEIFKMLDPLKRIYDYMVPGNYKHKEMLINGSIEPYAGDNINIKTSHRVDVLRSTIPKNLANKYGILETNNISESDIENIIKFLKDYPYYATSRFDIYPSLSPIYYFYHRAQNRYPNANKQLIIWIIKNLKLQVICRLIGDSSDPTINKAIKKMYFSINLDGQSESEYNLYLRNGAPPRLQSHVDEISHLLSLDIPEINNYNPGRRSWNAVISNFYEIEEEWKNSEETTNITNLDGVTEVFNFNDGTAWFNLNKEYCKLEGDSMRHCGNSAAWAEGDTILSLRKIEKNKTHKPILTFVVHKNGYLGEAKAKANTKPPEKYHDKIITLLSIKNSDGSWLIKGLQGGIYLTINDFKIDDLSDINKERLAAIRPDLVDPQEKEND